MLFHIKGFTGSGIETILGEVPPGIRKYNSDAIARLAYRRLRNHIRDGARTEPISTVDVILETTKIIEGILREVPLDAPVIVSGDFFVHLLIANRDSALLLLDIPRNELRMRHAEMQRAYRIKEQEIERDEEPISMTMDDVKVYLDCMYRYHGIGSRTSFTEYKREFYRCRDIALGAGSIVMKREEFRTMVAAIPR